jgi:hypothetical protein
MLYEVSCLENPQAALWLGENQNISVPILGPIQSVAERTATAVIAKIDKSPYFTEKFPYTHKTGSSDWQFPNNVWIPARTYETTAVLGLNSIGAYADELCLLRGAASGDLSAARAEMIYNAIAKRTHRLKQCPIASLTFAVSSTWNLGSRIVPRKLREAEDPENGVFARSYSLWGPRPKEFYGDSTFSVLVGRSGIPSKILTPAEVPLVRSILPTSRIIEVPEDFRREFERDLNGSLKDLAGEGLDAVS